MRSSLVSKSELQIESDALSADVFFQKGNNFVKVEPHDWNSSKPFRQQSSNNFEMQTLVYWYESAALSCLSAWGTTLSWSDSLVKTAMTTKKMARYLVPVGLAGVAYVANFALQLETPAATWCKTFSSFLATTSDTHSFPI